HQQGGETFVRVDKAAALSDGAYAVGVAVGAEARRAAFTNHHLLTGFHMWFDRLRIDPREERIQFAANLHDLHAAAPEDAGNNAATSSIHAVDANFETGVGDRIQIHEFRNGFDVWLLEIDFVYLCRRAFRHRTGMNLGFDLLDNVGARRSTEL